LLIVARVPEIPVDERADFLDAFAVVANSIEDTENCARTVNKLLEACGADPGDLHLLLSIAWRCSRNRGSLLDSPIYQTIAESPELDSHIRTMALSITHG
jgi:hypothetical protein